MRLLEQVKKINDNAQRERSINKRVEIQTVYSSIVMVKTVKNKKQKKHSEHNKADEGTLSSACVTACLNLNYLLQREEVWM